LPLPRIVVVSENSIKDIRDDFGVAEDRMRLVPVGVDPDLFRPVPGVEVHTPCRETFEGLHTKVTAHNTQALVASCDIDHSVRPSTEYRGGRPPPWPGCVSFSPIACAATPAKKTSPPPMLPATSARIFTTGTSLH
jgi:hypothetical protein